MLLKLRARLSHALESFAVPRKNLDAQLFFQLDDGFETPGCDVCRALAASVRLRDYAGRPLQHKTELMERFATNFS
ncbi:MAG: hypothetical protein IPI20_07395 [Rhodoferax sp.]|nr:hypothetical protein [Rhodoferax sp.]